MAQAGEEQGKELQLCSYGGAIIPAARVTVWQFRVTHAAVGNPLSYPVSKPNAFNGSPG